MPDDWEVQRSRHALNTVMRSLTGVHLTQEDAQIALQHVYMCSMIPFSKARALAVIESVAVASGGRLFRDD